MLHSLKSDAVNPSKPIARDAGGDVAWFRRPPHRMALLDTAAIGCHASARVVAELKSMLERRGHAVLLPSAGRSPQSTYANLRQEYRHSIDWSRVICVQMDEYAGLGDHDPRSLADELRRELVEPLQIGRFIAFNHPDGALRLPLVDYEKLVRSLGGIDCALHGIGRNFHVGFNEPGDPAAKTTRGVRLTSSTRHANGVSFTKGLTLGLDIISQARASIVILSGSAKREAAQALLYGEAGTENPAAAFRRCEDVTIFIDAEAAPDSLRR